MNTVARVLLAGFAAMSPAAPALAQDVSAMSGETAIDKVTDNLYSFRRGVYRSFFYITDAGVVVADPMDSKAAYAMRQEIGRLTRLPVKYVIYSTSLRDRASGAAIFKNEGAQIITQEGCAQNMRDTPFQDVLPPDITYKDSYALKIGGRQMDLHYFGPAYDTCQSVIVFRAEKLLFLANIVDPPGPAVPWNTDMANVYYYNIVPFLKKVEALAERDGIVQIMGAVIAVETTPDGKTRILPPTGPIVAVRQQREFWESFTADVKAATDKGATAATIGDRMDFTKYKSLRRYDETNLTFVAKRIVSYLATGR